MSSHEEERAELWELERERAIEHASFLDALERIDALRADPPHWIDARGHAHPLATMTTHYLEAVRGLVLQRGALPLLPPIDRELHKRYAALFAD